MEDEWIGMGMERSGTRSSIGVWKRQIGEPGFFPLLEGDKIWVWIIMLERRRRVPDVGDEA